jgi:hypothetical protein
MRHMANSLVEAMERMFDERLPVARRRAPRHQEESGDENSGFGRGFRDHYVDGLDGRGGGRRAGLEDRRARDDCAHGRHVRFDDEAESHGSHEEEFDDDDDENPFAHGGRFDRRPHHRRADFEGRRHHRGHRHHDDPNNIARVKLSIPKFTGKESADEYLEWAEQCDQIFRVHNLSDQRCVNLASVELSGYALTWWNQVQENQLDLGFGYINTWEEMKRVMRRRFVPSSYQRDVRNRLQVLKQGKRPVDEYYKEMELLLVHAELEKIQSQRWPDFWVVSMKTLLVLLRCFPIVLCKISLIKLGALREKFSKRHVEDLMEIIP